MKALKQFFSMMKETASEWSNDKASRLAAALALYTLLSMAPLLMLIVAIMGLFFGDDAARGEVATQLRNLMGPQPSQAVETVLQSANRPTQGIVATVGSVAVLLFGASGVFGELQDSLNTIWEVAPKPGRGIKGLIKDRFFSFTMVLGVAFLLLVSLVLTTALSAVGHVVAPASGALAALWQVVNFVASFGLVAVLFALIFKIIPDVRIAWKNVWTGALFTAFLFTVGKLVLGIYLGRASVASPYGAAGSIVVLVMWVYYSAQILFFGAEFTQVHARRQGAKMTPTSDAVPLTAEAKANLGLVDSKTKEPTTKRDEPSAPSTLTPQSVR